MDFEFMHKAFPNYTRPMWEGNEPSRPGPRMVNGGICEHWSCEKGLADTYKGQVLQADFGWGDSCSVWLWHDKLQISRVMADRLRQFNVNMDRTKGTRWEQMGSEEAERILRRKIPNCKIWDMVQARAWEIYNGR